MPQLLVVGKANKLEIGISKSFLASSHLENLTRLLSFLLAYSDENHNKGVVTHVCDLGTSNPSAK